jgi:hypothetical protein
MDAPCSATAIDRVVEQHTVMVEVAAGKRTVIIKKASGRGGRLM